MDLDVRDVLFWTKESQKRILLNRMEGYNTARMANATNEDYRNIMMQLEWQLAWIDLTKEEKELAANPKIVKPGEN